MTDLEERVTRRDRGFLLRLVLVLAAGLLVGVMLFGSLTGDSTIRCAAEGIGGPGALEGE